MIPIIIYYPVADAYSATVQLSVSTPCYVHIFYLLAFTWAIPVHLWHHSDPPDTFLRFRGPCGRLRAAISTQRLQTDSVIAFWGISGCTFWVTFWTYSVIFAASILFVNGAPVEARVPFWRFWGVRWAWFWASGVDAETEPTEGAILDSDWQGAQIVFYMPVRGFITIWHGGAFILLEY